MGGRERKRARGMEGTELMPKGREEEEEEIEGGMGNTLSHAESRRGINEQ